MKNQLKKSLGFLLIVFVPLFGCNDKNKEGNMIEPPQGGLILESTINVGSTPEVHSVPNKISVTVPPGAAPNGAKLRIEEVQLSNAPQDQSVTMHKVYNVTISSGSQFTTPLEISLYYDAAKIPSGTQFTTIGASYYSTNLQKWISYQDVAVDKSTNKVTFKTNHLTTLSVWHRQYTYGYTNFLSSTHFNVYWKAGEPMSNSQYQSPYTTHANSTDPYYVQDLLTFLEDSYTAFKNNNLWVPTWVKVDVYVKDLGSVDGNSSFFGYLNINKKIDAGTTGKVSDVMQQTAAHEFLHYVQDYYYMQLFSDYTSKWWLEATATQADHIVYSNRASYEAVEFADGSIQAQLDKSWDDCNSDPEFYKAGGFLSYIGFYRSGQKANIPALIRECGNKFTLNNIRTIIDNYNLTNLAGWKGIGKEYSDYVRWAMERQGAIKIPIMPVITNNDAWVKPVTLSALGSQNVSVTIPHMAAAVVKIKNTNTTNSTISIIGTNITSEIGAYLYNSASNSISGPYSTSLSKGDSLITYLYPGATWRDFLLVNTSKDNAISVSLKISLRADQYCVTAGTLVMLEDGRTRPIELIKPDDRIIAFDTIALKKTNATVEKLLVHRDKTYPINNVKFSNKTDLMITGNHPIFVKDKGWITVDNLKPGDIVYNYDKSGKNFNNSKVVSIIKDVSISNVVYNLKTTQGNYIANDILIHNKCLKKGTSIETPDGPIFVEDIKPGMEVYASEDGTKIKTLVTNVYNKSTILDFIPGKKLCDGSEVTINHQVYFKGKFVTALELPFNDVKIYGNVYDIKTEAGNYYSNGFLMK